MNLMTIAAKGLAKASKCSPKALLISGIGCMVVGAVMACDATTKASHIVEEFHEERDQIEEAKQLAEEKKIVYTDQDESKDIAKVYFRTGWKFLKHYWKAIGVFTLGALLVVQGHNILNKRNLALMAAYSSLDTTFKDYRGNIREKYGEEADYGALHGFETEEVKMIDENGEVKEVESLGIDPGKPSIYSILWDDQTSTEWTNNPDTNKLILMAKEKYWTDVLKTRGYVHLDEVYRDLGVWGRLQGEEGERQMKAATAVGWVLGCGDDFVSFGLTDKIIHNKSKLNDFVGGIEPSFLLDFNIDGVIHDLL